MGLEVTSDFLLLGIVFANTLISYCEASYLLTDNARGIKWTLSWDHNDNAQGLKCNLFDLHLDIAHLKLEKVNLIKRSVFQKVNENSAANFFLLFLVPAINSFLKRGSVSWHIYQYCMGINISLF